MAFFNRNYLQYNQLSLRTTYSSDYQAIIAAINKENVLQSFPPFSFGISGHFNNLAEIVNSRLRILQLETTESCNLRCHYCIYSGLNPERRAHGNAHMPLSYGLRAIEYLKAHSGRREKVSITFYGGEPLLRYAFIRDCVHYSHRIMPEKEIHYSLTTNGLLLTKPMAEFFKANNFGLVFSIDGPREFHDRFRRRANGCGSFDQAIQGFKKAIEVYSSEAANRIMLSMVYTPPYNEQHLSNIASLWLDHNLIPDQMAARIGYPSPGTISRCLVREDEIVEDVSLGDWGLKQYDSFIYHKSPLHPLVRSICETTLARIYQRSIYDHPIQRYQLNGCCIPAGRKLFLTARGDYRICERVPDSAPNIGHVNHGLDMDVIQSVYINQYAEESTRTCYDCWLIQFCQLCYVHFFRNRNMELSNRALLCGYARASIEAFMKHMCAYVEFNASSLNHLNDIVLE